MPLPCSCIEMCVCGFFWSVNKVLHGFSLNVKPWCIPRISPLGHEGVCCVLLYLICETLWQVCEGCWCCSAVAVAGTWGMLATLPSSAWAPVGLHPWQHLLLSGFSFLNLMRVKCCHRYCLIFFAFPPGLRKWTFSVYTAVCGYPSVRMSVYVFCPVFFWIFLLILDFCLYRVYDSSIGCISDQLSFQFAAGLFTFLMVSSDELEFLIYCSGVFFSLCQMPFPVFKKLFQAPDS